MIGVNVLMSAAETQQCSDAFLKGQVALLLPRLESLGQLAEEASRRLLTADHRPELIPATDGAFTTAVFAGKAGDHGE